MYVSKTATFNGIQTYMKRRNHGASLKRDARNTQSIFYDVYI